MVPTTDIKAMTERLLAADPSAQRIRQRLGVTASIVLRSPNSADVPKVLRHSAMNLMQIHEPPKDLIAVQLGATDDDLAVLGCRSPSELQAFLGQNPALAESLTTIWNGWYLLWLRTDVRCENVILEGWMWLVKAAIPVYVLGSVVEFVRDGESVRVAFESIKWSQALGQRLQMAQLRQKYGQCFHRASGKKTLNELFWANVLAEVLNVYYDPDRDGFLQPADDGTPARKLDCQDVRRLVADAMQTFAGVWHEGFPLNELRPARIRQLIERMKVAAMARARKEPDELSLYCSTRLRLEPGATVTTEELWADYASSHTLREWSRHQFFQRIANEIKKAFGRTKSHDIKRNGRARKGFRGLALTSKQAAP